MPDEIDAARATCLFPLVGLGVGAFCAVVLVVAEQLFPAFIAVIAALAAGVWLTGALHEDGLADLADALGGGWSRERVLEILKDPGLGSYGVLTLLFAMAGKLAALVSLEPATAVRALLAAHVVARASSLPLLWRLPYVKRPESRSTLFADSVSAARFTAGTGFAAVMALCFLGPWVGAATVGTTAGLCALAISLFDRRLGGVTGDALGALNQVVELATYLVVVAAAGPGR